MNSPYADIIHLPHHVSQNHQQMPMLDRAAQFAPFAALTGYEAAVGETARLTAERRELDAQEAEELNRRLAALIANLPDRPEATIEYFVPDDRKSGGAYVTVTGRVRHISVPEKTLVMEDGTVIGLEDIAAISGFQFIYLSNIYDDKLRGDFVFVFLYGLCPPGRDKTHIHDVPGCRNIPIRDLLKHAKQESLCCQRRE